MNEALLTTVIILSGVFFFIYLFALRHKRAFKKKIAMQQNFLADIVWKNKLELSMQETINNNLLAIDKKHLIFLHINYRNDKEEVALIDLWQIKAVKITTEENSIYEQIKGKPVLIDKQVSKLHLEITLSDVLQKTMLVLYNNEDGMQDFVELKKRANHWCRLLNKALHELPHPARQTLQFA